MVTMTREEHDQLLAELDLPYEQRQRLQQEREQRKQSSERTSRNLSDTEMTRWNAHFENRLSQAIAKQHEFMIQVVGEALGEVSNQLREEIEKTITAKLTQASDQKLADSIRGSLDDLKQEIKKIRGGLTGEVSDLPNPIADRRLN
jgi:ssDNA-binding replication factor A large subunit